MTLAINYGHEIMDYLQSKSILIGTLPKNPSGDYKAFLVKPPTYDSNDRKESRDMKAKNLSNLLEDGW